VPSGIGESRKVDNVIGMVIKDGRSLKVNPSTTDSFTVIMSIEEV
jgi:hypothetical protein